MKSVANEEQRAYWNREEARHWVEHQHRYDEMLAPFGEAVLAAAAIGPAEQVLDIGCGNGATTRAAARIASDGSALGVDLSEEMITRARELAVEERVDNVTFVVDDVQTCAFDPDFDCAISRFGVMFFDDPVAAFANVHHALHPGGRFAFVVWQELVANEWIAVPGAAMLAHVELPEADPDAPGPFAFADPDRVRAILHAAGFTDIGIDAFEVPMLVGGRGTLDDAVSFMRNTGIAHTLLDDKPPAVVARVLAAVRDALAPHSTHEGVWLGGAAWVVSGRSLSRR